MRSGTGVAGKESLIMKTINEEMDLITKRDRELMRWINAVGFATIYFIAEKLNIAVSTAYGLVKKLLANEYLIHHQLYYGMPSVYYLTEKGAENSGSYLPPLRKISKGSYDHDLIVTQLVLRLAKKFNAELITERELRYRKAQDGIIGQPGHISDGILIIDNKRIAIEVELHQKGSRRLKKIMSEYMKNFDLDEVWYFCGSNDVHRQISEYQSTCSFLKVFHLNNYLNTENKE